MSFEDTERLNVLLKNADHFKESKDFERALQQYSKAIVIPRLSPKNLGNIYEKRAACYLSLKTEPNFADQAIIDVEQALKLNKSSWNAYYLKAQCHKAKNNLPEAILNYKLALAISPIPKQVKEDLDSCELLNSIQKANAHLNHDRLPVSGSDLVGDVDGRKLTVTQYAELYGYQNFPVYLGNKYYHGFDVPQDYTKAVKYYAQADKQGYAEGCFFLGQCYYHGHGVKQDVSKSVEIFKRCAKMEARKRRNFEIYTPLGFNNGVASAEYAVGKSYEHGIGVEENVTEAARWYTRAMERGQGDAASCLGLLYYEGHILKRTTKCRKCVGSKV